MSGNRQIQTLLGKILPEQLGYCQCHEHLFIAKGKSFAINSALWFDDLKLTIQEVKRYHQLGGRSIVDAQPIGCGRMTEYLIKTSQETGVQIIAATGFHKLAFYEKEHWIESWDEEQLTCLFLNEINKGMYVDGDFSVPYRRSEAKSGVIKAALDTVGITGTYRKLFAAAANASLETGVPLLCHVENGKDAFEVINYFINRGIQPASIIICHLDRARYDHIYHRDVAQAGVYLEYDTIGRFKYHNDEKEIELISSMVAAGFEGQILLGLDTTRERLKSYGSTIGLDYIHTVFAGLLVKYGVSQQLVDKFLVGNPQKALSFL